MSLVERHTHGNIYTCRRQGIRNKPKTFMEHYSVVLSNIPKGLAICMNNFTHFDKNSPSIAHIKRINIKTILFNYHNRSIFGHLIPVERARTFANFYTLSSYQKVASFMSKCGGCILETFPSQFGPNMEMSTVRNRNVYSLRDIGS